jgi:hypothetical protein
MIRQITSELASATPADLSLFPTLRSLEFAAFSLLENPAPMIGMVHLEPNFEHPHASRLWAMAADRVLQRNLNVTVCAIDPLIGDFLRTYSDSLPVIEMPVPLGGKPKLQYAQSLDIIGFFGHQREERGLAIIPPLVDKLLGLGYKVVIHDTRGRFSAKGTPSNLRLFNSFVGDLNLEMAKCDLVVCLMHWNRYLHRSSGIACTAIASGVPFVLPAGTLSAVRFCNPGSAACYYEHSIDGVMEAIQRIDSNYPKYTAAAKQGAMNWNKNHGVERFVDRIVEYVEPKMQSGG